jgi:DNA polymerase I-like protein with 3'-5' exonuclease and polymerase domains
VDRPDAEPQQYLSALVRACMVLGRRLASVERQRELYETVEQPLIPVLAIMELTPVTVDAGMIRNMQSVVQVPFTLHHFIDSTFVGERDIAYLFFLLLKVAPVSW